MPKRRKDSDADNNKKSKSNGAGVHDESNTTNTSAIPIFLKKTYRMIETCNPEICSWSDDGEMFIVKNPEVFASDIIPQYFDHNKFSSFARQLNFYGFRKIQTKPIRNEDFDKSTAKHVTFYNEKFKRGRYDLLKDIQRSTRGGGAQASLADQQREMETLRSTVANLENRVQELESRWSELAMKMEREIQAKVELAVMDVFSSSGRQGLNPTSTLQAAQYNMGMPSLPTSFGDASILQRAERSFGSIGRNTSELGGAWQNPLLQGSQAARAFSTASASSLSGQGGGNKGGGAGSGGAGGGGGGNNGGNAGGQSAGDAAAASGGAAAGATLPPHPKQKSLPPPPANMGGVPQSASGGLRNLSSGGLNLQGGGGNSMLLRNAWEDKFFSTLMMTDGASRAASLAGLNPGMAGGNASGLAALAAAQQAQNQQRMMAQVQAQAQAQMNAGKGGAVGGGGGGPEAGGSDNLQRQTTAEILLEAAGELGGARGGGAPGKVGDKGKGGNDGPDGKEVGV